MDACIWKKISNHYFYPFKQHYQSITTSLFYKTAAIWRPITYIQHMGIKNKYKIIHFIYFTYNRDYAALLWYI